MADILKLKNGVELPYIELGKDNKTVLIIGQFYFNTFMPFVEAMAKTFHVYAVTMRTYEPVTEYLENGKPNWEDMWAKEFIEFADTMGIDKFIYAGKCHGTTVGWRLMQLCQERLLGHVMLSLLPTDRTPGFINQKFIDVMKIQLTDREQFVKVCLRNHDLVGKKLEEMASANLALVTTGNQKALSTLTTNEELFEFYESLTVPSLLLYGGDDPGLDPNMYMESVMRMKGLKAIIYQGEKHLYEMDIPEKLAEDIAFWAQQNCLIK